MRYACRLVTLLLSTVLAAGVCLAAEVESGEGNSAWAPAAPVTDWNLQLSIQHLPSSGLRSLPGDAGITDYRAKATHTLTNDQDLTLTLGVGYGLKQIDAASRAALPQELHALFLEAGASYRINKRAFANIRLIPGFHSDFQDLGSDDLRMPILALGGYSFDNGFTVVGGLLYRLGYHSGALIPALGFSYQPNRSWRLDLVAPRPSLTYFASRQLQLFVAGDFASDEYELKDRSQGAKVIKYGDYKAMAGLNYLIDPAIKLSTSVGYAFDRTFSFYDATRPDLRLDDVPFFRVALDIGW